MSKSIQPPSIKKIYIREERNRDCKSSSVGWVEAPPPLFAIRERDRDIFDQRQSSSLKTEEWMTTEEAAEFLRISKASLLNLSSNGKIPYYKLERRNRYLKSDLLKLLLSNRRGGFNGS